MELALPLAFGAAGLAASTVMRPKAKTVKALPTPTRNMAAEQAASSDKVSRRRGVAANLLLGAGGAESTTGTKTQLGT